MTRINRRNFVAGAACSLPVAAVAAPAALARTAPAVSHQAAIEIATSNRIGFEIAAEFFRLDSLLDKALVVFGEAETRLLASRPPFPDWGDLTGSPDKKAAEAAEAEYTRQCRVWHEENNRLGKMVGFEAADEAVNEIHAEMDTLLMRYCKTPALSLRSVFTKAMVASHIPDCLELRESIVQDLLNLKSTDRGKM